MSELDRLVNRLATRNFAASPELKEALRRVDPALFVAREYRFLAHEDVPVPYQAGLDVPALLTSRRWAAVLYQLLAPAGGEDFLILGSDGGYLAALLSSGDPHRRVTVVEAGERRARRTRENLQRAGFEDAVRVTESVPDGRWSRVVWPRPPGEDVTPLRRRLRNLGFLLWPRRTSEGHEVVKVLRSGDEFGEMAFREATPGAAETGGEATLHLAGLLALEELLANVWKGSVDSPRDRFFHDLAETTFQGGPWDRGELSKEETARFLRAKTAFRLAHIHQMTGDLQNAERLYRKSLEAYPTAESHTFLGWTYSFVDRLDDAIRECRKAIEVDPSLGNPYNDVGAYLIQQGRLDEAIPWLRRATRAPRYCCYFYAYCNLGRVYLMKREYEAARDAFRQALESNPEYDLARELLEEAERHLP